MAVCNWMHLDALEDGILPSTLDLASNDSVTGLCLCQLLLTSIAFSCLSHTSLASVSMLLLQQSCASKHVNGVSLCLLSCWIFHSATGRVQAVTGLFHRITDSSWMTELHLMAVCYWMHLDALEDCTLTSAWALASNDSVTGLCLDQLLRTSIALSCQSHTPLASVSMLLLQQSGASTVTG